MVVDGIGGNNDVATDAPTDGDGAEGPPTKMKKEDFDALLLPVQSLVIFGALLIGHADVEGGSNVTFIHTLVVLVKDNRKSTKISVIRGALNVAAALGAKRVVIVTRVSFMDNSKKLAKRGYPDMQLVFWSDEDLSYDWYNNAVMNPMAVVRQPASGDEVAQQKRAAVLGHTLATTTDNEMSALFEGAIAARFDLHAGDLLHSQRFVPKLVRSLRLYRGDGDGSGDNAEANTEENKE